MFRINELRCKEVVNLKDGMRLGFPEDAELDSDSGKILSIIVPGEAKFLGFFGRGDDIVIPWEDIKKIGSDIILVSFEKPIKISSDGSFSNLLSKILK